MKKHTKLFIILGIFLTLCVLLILTRNNKVNNIHEETSNNREIKKSFSNGLALMIETGPRTGTYEKSTDGVWPTDGYVFNKKLSKCLNGGVLTWDEATKKIYMSSDSNDKCYVYFNVYVKPSIADYCSSGDTLATCVKNFGDQGSEISSIYIHNSSLTNGAGDNSYRYAGANPNNYVCFGSDEEICPDDNLYRIIGVFDENVKLIKTISVRNMEWASDSQKTYLNGEYILNLGIYTKNIINTMWKIGGSSPQNIKNVVPSVVYQNEIKNPEDVSTNTLQIGLMYVSDYGFAASPSAWTTNLESYNSSLITSVNWLYLGLKEWTITKAGVNYSNVYRIDDTGTIIREYDRDNGKKGEIRPTFYLNSNIYYITGSGTYSDPIRIS